MKFKVETLRKIEREDSRLLGVVNVSINDVLVIENIKIIQAPDHKFIAMPSKKINDTYADFAHPTNAETRDELKEVVLSAYEGKENQNGDLEETVITDVKIRYTSNATGLVAIAHVVLNDKIVLHDMFLVKELTPDGKSCFKFYMPSVENSEGLRRNIFYSINRAFSDKLFNTVFEAYKKGLN